MIVVYIHDPGILGIIVSEHIGHVVVKYYLDGITHIESLVEDEYVIYGGGEIGGTDVRTMDL